MGVCQVIDRRDKSRFPGQVLFIKIGIRPYPIIDISSGGLGFEAENYAVGDMVRLRIVSVLDKYDFADAVCEVMRVDGFRVAARFAQPSAALTEFVETYIRQWT